MKNATLFCFSEKRRVLFFSSIFNLFKFVLFKIPGFQIKSRPLIVGVFFQCKKHKPGKINIPTFPKLYFDSKPCVFKA